MIISNSVSDDDQEMGRNSVRSSIESWKGKDLGCEEEQDTRRRQKREVREIPFECMLQF